MLQCSVTIDINHSNYNLPQSSYDSALRDCVNNKIYYDTLEKADTELDEFEVNMGDSTFLSEGNAFLSPA